MRGFQPGKCSRFRTFNDSSASLSACCSTGFFRPALSCFNRRSMATSARAIFSGKFSGSRSDNASWQSLRHAGMGTVICRARLRPILSSQRAVPRETFSGLAPKDGQDANADSQCNPERKPFRADHTHRVRLACGGIHRPSGTTAWYLCPRSERPFGSGRENGGRIPIPENFSTRLIPLL